ncbi:MAG: phytanoyl-CoA dioxygenase family protein [Terriglobia bacterium]
MLSSKEVNQYKNDGYCVSSEFLNRAQLDRMLKEIEEMSAGSTVSSHDATRMEMEPLQPPSGTLVRRIYDPCTYYPSFREFSESAVLLDALEQLLGPNLELHYSKINMKPPAIGSVVDWHQDLSYYPLTNQDSLAVLFYLDDATRTNGCLQVIPGPQTQPLLNHTRDGIFQGRITEPVEASKSVALEGRAGTAIFMNGMTPHASAPNTSPHPRRTLILSYRAADAFPIYIPEMTAKQAVHSRLVRGHRATVARFTMGAFPIPRYPKQTKSLYELQELSREKEHRESNSAQRPD